MTQNNALVEDVRIRIISPAGAMGAYNDGTAGTPAQRMFLEGEQFDAKKITPAGSSQPVYVVTLANVNYSIPSGALEEMGAPNPSSQTTEYPNPSESRCPFMRWYKRQVKKFGGKFHLVPLSLGLVAAYAILKYGFKVKWL